MDQFMGDRSQPTTVGETPATSDETSVINLCFNQNSTLPKGWNIKLPPQGSTDVYFATQCLLPITITIMDQFGNNLDPMYDGYHVVHETITGNTTINDQPIDNPDGFFTSGEIIDNVTETLAVPDDPSDKQFAFLVAQWPSFNGLFSAYPSAGGGVWDNAIALHYSDTTLLDHQTISINGIQLPGTWDRSIVLIQQDHIKHKDGQPHGVIMSVNETYIKPPT